MSRMIDFIAIPPLMIVGAYLTYIWIKAGPIPRDDIRHKRQPKIGE